MIIIMIPNYSKESERRKISRHQEQWKSRNLKGKKNRARKVYVYAVGKCNPKL